MYTLANLTDAQLKELSNECYVERIRRIRKNMASYPVPSPPNGRSRVECIKDYREAHKVDLFVAREVVEYHWTY